MSPLANTPLRILLVDQHGVLSPELGSALFEDSGFSVSRAESAIEATRHARAQEPHVVVCETTLEEPGAVELARFFRLRMPNTVIIFITQRYAEAELFEAARVGAAAYLRANLERHTFISALRRAARGEFLIDEDIMRRPAVASRVLAQFRLKPVETTAAPSDQRSQTGVVPSAETPGNGTDPLAPLYVPLSPREIEILDLVARGNSNKLIGRQLGISDQTVKNHITTILRKLEVNDRTEAVVFALRNGWIRMDRVARAGS